MMPSLVQHSNLADLSFRLEYLDMQHSVGWTVDEYSQRGARSHSWVLSES